MKKKLIYLIIVISIISLIAVGIIYSNQKNSNAHNIPDKNIEENVIKVESIEVDREEIELLIGENVKINIEVLPSNAFYKDIVWTSSNESIATVDNEGSILASGVGDCDIKVYSKKYQDVCKNIKVTVKEEPKTIVQEQAGITYINGILIVNKKYSVPANYSPGMLNETLNAYYELRAAAANAGYDMPLLSGYRSYETQKNLYNNYVTTYGQAEADTFSARPGTSEHQTGLAMDVGWIDDDYAYTDSGKWLANNCYLYGFIVRYPKGKEYITGYKYEPWHIRYLGKDVAKQVYDSGLCLEEYLGIAE